MRLLYTEVVLHMDIHLTATGAYALIGVGAIGLLGLLTMGGFLLSALFSPEYQRHRSYTRRADLRHNRWMAAKRRRDEKFGR